MSLQHLVGQAGLVLLAGLAPLAANPADLLTVAAVLAATVLATAVAVRLVLRPQLGAASQVRVLPAVRERIRRRSVPRLCDPDARGRRRPRAPSPYPSAA